MSDESDTEANVDTTKDSKRSGLLNISYLDTILHPDRVSAALEQEDIDGYGQEADDSGSPSASPPGIRLQLHGSVDDTIDSLEDADRADGRFGEPEDEDAKDYGRSEENPQNETLPNPDGDDWMLQLERLAGDDGENTGAQANYGARSSARHRMAARQAAVEDPAEDDWMAQLERAAEGGEMEDESDRYARASKRRASDLFGFDDSDVENAFPSKSSKRKLFSEDLDLRSEDDSEARARREVQERQQVVDEIRRARKANQDAEAALQTVYRWDYKRPPPGASVRARTSDQNTEVFFPFRRAVVVDPVADLRESNEHGSLLHGDNIYRILDEIDREREEKNAKDQTETQLQDIGMTADDARELAYEVHGEHALRSGKPEDRMWTDKYRPRKYTDLIGDETVNRSVLSWVKAWDYCVFGRKPKAGIIPAHEQASNRNFRGGFRGRGRGAPGGADGPSRNGPTAPPKDKFLRPDSRILLIGGPPGLGKTTLAHVVARHCGYDVIEINASDERAASTLTNRVEAATQNRSLLGSTITGSKSKTDSNGQGKPSLIVLDEIDGVSQAEGAGGNFIKILVEMVTASADSGAQDGDGPDGENQEDGEETGAAKKRGKKGKKVAKYPPLRRPIICICNDPYSPALRELRNVALLINIRVPPVKVLAKRLEDICQWEGLSVELRTLMALVEETQGDIRSCLLTLQVRLTVTNPICYSG